MEAIQSAVRTACAQYPIKRVELFGSYANGTASEDSDVDFLVEFAEHPISIFKICGFQAALSELLHLDVDVVKLPLKKDSPLVIDRSVCLYES
ncbi:MAG: nucleotidyltransferase domain-containing protein [Clostridia bacterium]